MKTLASSLIACASLFSAGCGGNPGMSPQAAIQNGISDCNQRFQKRVRGQATDYQRCVSETNNRYAEISGAGLATDLIRLAGAKSIEAAERYDAGKLTESQYEVELASIDAERRGGAHGRATQTAAAQAAVNQAAAAENMAATQRLRTVQDAFAPKNTTCTGSGNSVTCSPSY